MHSPTPPVDLHDKQLRRWGIPLVSLSAVMALMFFYFPGQWHLFFWYFPVALVCVVFFWEMSRWIIRRVRTRYQGIQHTWKRIVYIVLFNCLLAGLVISAVKVPFYYFGIVPDSLATVSFQKSLLTDLLVNFSFIVVIAALYEAFYFFEQYRGVLQKTEQLKKQQAQQRFEALKNRVNPHFLFNSLTTLSALIAEDATRAERFVDELSLVYRYLLRTAVAQPVAIADEIRFAHSYIFLLQNRFEQGTFTCKLPTTGLDNTHDTLPALSLQHALDYTIRTQNLPLAVDMSLQPGALQLSCAHQPKNLSFEAIAADWNILSAQGAVQRVEGDRFSIYIPLITGQTS